MDGTVLVADDDRTIRTVLTQALTRAGCKVHATSSLTTLMRWVSEGKGDLVISDVMMPDGNGLEMLPAIREQRPSLPVIIISAQNTIMTAIQATEADAYDYLPKPFDLPDLIYPAVDVRIWHVSGRQAFGRRGIGDKRNIFRPHDHRNEVLAMALSQPGVLESLAANLKLHGVVKPFIGLYTVDGLRGIGLGDNLCTGIDEYLAA